MRKDFSSTNRAYPALPKPAIFAHRGASAHAPENTLASFELAIRHGADVIEMDVTLCRDDQLVVIHDSSVDRTTDGTGLVRNLAFSALRELDAGSHFDVAYQGERIPALDEVFETVGKRIAINIELKPAFLPVGFLTEKVASSLVHHALVGRVIVSSFYPAILNRLRKLLPGVALGLLTLRGIKGALFRSRLYARFLPYQSLHPEFHDVSPALVKRVQSAGRRVNVYTINSTHEMTGLLSMGIDGIITDDPQLVKKVLRKGQVSIHSR